jgi:regulator of protease activity HflC (stomatin/prohibitin superfamily)
MIGLILAIIALIAGFIVGAKLDKREYPGFKAAAPVVGIVLAIVLIILSCVSYVPTGYTGIVTTFGKVHENTLDAGINFHAPWDTVITMDNREQRATFQLEAFSKDIQQVDIQGSINYNIDKSTAMNLYRDVGTDYATILINPRIQEDVKIIIAQYTAENLISNRQVAADAMFELIKKELEPKGINVISFAVENIDFTDAFETAVEAKQVATQEKQRAQTQQEQQTMEAEQAAKRKKIEAEAAAEVQKIDADARAYATKVEAEAEAEANKKLNASITDELINYNQILKWNGALPTFMGGESTIPILNFGGAE